MNALSFNFSSLPELTSSQDLCIILHNIPYIIVIIVIRTSDYVFCRRNKDWDNPELMTF